MSITRKKQMNAMFFPASQHIPQWHEPPILPLTTKFILNIWERNFPKIPRIVIFLQGHGTLSHAQMLKVESALYRLSTTEETSKCC